jgi:predicted nucleic acid-binding protein
LGGTLLKDVLFRRRLRMARLLAMNTSLNVVVETLSKEFNVTTKAIYKDHVNMDVWSHAIEQDKQLTAILRARLGLLSREALTLAMENKGQLTVKDKFVKIGAINTALKVTDREIQYAQELGLIERKPLEINEKLSVVTPFEADPMLREALLDSIVKQKAEKAERDAANGSDAPRL